jgi:FtsP/CotA-like multicopper oxidase with cupredoxin domain
MSKRLTSRRDFLTVTAAAAGAGIVGLRSPMGLAAMHTPRVPGIASPQASADPPDGTPDYVLRIAASPIEIAPKHIVSAVTYNGQFPGPLLRFKEGQTVIVKVHNDTDTPEQLHWHGQFVPTDVDGAAEEGTPFIPAHGKRRIVFTPRPAGFRFYHTHNRAGVDLHAGQYSGQVGPVYIESKHEPGNYDREVFLVLKEFEPSWSRGGDMSMDMLAGTPLRVLRISERPPTRRTKTRPRGSRQATGSLASTDGWPGTANRSA